MLPTGHLDSILRRIREELKVACAELHLAHQALQRHLPAEAREPDVAWAIGQNAAVERRLAQALDELDDVASLLQSHYPS